MKYVQADRVGDFCQERQVPCMPPLQHMCDNVCNTTCVLMFGFRQFLQNNSPSFSLVHLLKSCLVQALLMPGEAVGAVAAGS